jgi:thymidylate synthase ThyX
VKVTIIEYPTDQDWLAVKQRALVTVGLDAKNPPDMKWKKAILAARHSPIRRLHFAFLIEDLPSWVSVHLCRHVHAQPYVRSQRNDRQSSYDRNKAPQDSPVSMIWDMNAEELMTIASKRLCAMASAETQAVVWQMCQQVVCMCPEFEGMLKPACDWQNGKCYEMNGGCGKYA